MSIYSNHTVSVHILVVRCHHKMLGVSTYEGKEVHLTHFWESECSISIVPVILCTAGRIVKPLRKDGSYMGI